MNLKQYPILLLLLSLFVSCTTTQMLPTSSNVDESILMLSPNRDLRADFSVSSEQKDGALPLFDEKEKAITVVKYIHQTETSLKKIWDEYFSTKYNSMSKEDVKISIIQDEFKVYKKNLSGGFDKFSVAWNGTGNLSYQFEVNSEIEIVVIYKGEEHKKKFKIKVDEQSQANYYRGYGGANKNEIELVSKMIQKAYNKGIMFVDNYLKSILPSSKN